METRRVVVGILILGLAVLSGKPVYAAEASGKITMLAVQDVGLMYDSPDDQIDVEVFIQLDTEPGRAFGFQLRRQENVPSGEAMLHLLRDAFNNDWTVSIDYSLEPGKRNGLILQTMLTRARLPERPPKPVVLEMLGPEAGWPPQVKGATNVTLVPWTEVSGALTDERAAMIRGAALSTSKVRALLGERFAYISTDEIESRKTRVEPSQALNTRITFFSHSNNAAVEVLMQGEEVIKAANKEGYQPPEGIEEIDLAIALARRDSRIKDRVRGLVGTAILTFPKQGQAGYGNRVLDVTFGYDEETTPLYRALVDLTTQKILRAGRVPGR